MFDAIGVYGCFKNIINAAVITMHLAAA